MLLIFDGKRIITLIRYCCSIWDQILSSEFHSETHPTHFLVSERPVSHKKKKWKLEFLTELNFINKLALKSVCHNHRFSFHTEIIYQNINVVQSELTEYTFNFPTTSVHLYLFIHSLYFLLDCIQLEFMLCTIMNIQSNITQTTASVTSCH